MKSWKRLMGQNKEVQQTKDKKTFSFSVMFSWYDQSLISKGEPGH